MRCRRLSHIKRFMIVLIFLNDVHVKACVHARELYLSHTHTHTHTHIHTHTCVCVYIYIYMFFFTVYFH